MKILIDLTPLYDHFSGIERYAACLTQAMIRNRKNTFILVFRNEVSPMFREAEALDHVETMVVSGGNRLIFNQLILPLALMKQRADAYLFLAFPAPVLLMKKNMVSAIHDIGCWDCPECMKAESRWYFRISYRAALLKDRKTLTVSDFSRRRIMERLHVRPDRLELIYDGTDEKFLNYAPDEAAEACIREKYQLPARYILSLSTLEPRKNLRLLIEAYQRLVRAGAVQEELVLVGRKGWKIDDLMKGVDEEAAARIRFTGFVDDEDLPAIYGMARLFVFPSRYEGFGLPPLEAMACGAPVLSSDASSMPEVLGDAAAYFRSEDADALEKKITELLRLDDAQRGEMQEAGRSRARLFRWEREAEKLERMLELMVR